MNSPFTHLSSTALSAYWGCPKAFRLRHVAHERPTVGPKASLAVDAAIRHALHMWHGLENQDEPLVVALRRVWPQYRTVALFPTPEVEVEAWRCALELVENYLRCFAPRVGRVLALEEQVAHRLPSGRVVYGKVDRIDKTPAGRLEIVQYETGERETSEVDLALDPAVLVSLHGAESVYGRPVEAVRAQNIASGVETVWRPTAAGRFQTAERLDDLTMSVTLDDVFAATPGPACRSCAFRRSCSQRGKVSLSDLKTLVELPF